MADRTPQENYLDLFGSGLLENSPYELDLAYRGLGLQPPPQGLPVDTRPYDRMQATPRGFISGLFSDVLGGTLNMPSMPRTGVPSLDLLYANRNPLFNLMGVGDVQKTAERISYGEPLTTGQGMTLKPREETIGAALTVAPFAGEAARLGVRAGRAGARMVGQGIAENVAMGRPNLPSMFAEPRSSLFAVEPNPSMAAADESSAMRQQLTGKMQALLAQKKVATSAVEVGAINQQIGELQAQFKSLPTVQRVAREVVAPEITAPVSDLGFYSAAEQAAMNLERSKGTGQSFLNDLMNAPDVKKDELSWIGLDDFLKDKPNVTKQEVQDFIASNKIDLQEVSYGNIDFAKLPDQQLQKEYVRVRGYEPLDSDGSLMSREEIIYELSGAPATDLTRYGKYQLAGGENYREILLKIPENMSEYNKYTESLRAKYGQGGFANLPLTDIERARLEKFYANEDVKPYKTTHWQDPNVLAHIRVNDRVDADGKKMLLVEEIQSDWHQAGREKGYATRESLEKWYNQNKLENDPAFADLNSEQIKIAERNRSAGLGGESVPDAPFKDTWYQLALKRIMKYAADNGYERVGLTTGKQQADRYKLSNEVDEINIVDRNYMTTGEKIKQVALDMKSGQSLKLGVNKDEIVIDVSDETIQNFMGKKLSEVVGKDIAKEIMTSNKKTISGEGLDIGGQGMKKYYDEIYPKFLEKYGKKWDAGVGETKIITEDNAWNMAEQIKQRGISDAQWRALSEEDKLKLWNDIKQSVGRKQEPIRYIDITPKMKEGVKKGQPLASAEQAPQMLASGGLDYADPFKNPLLESTIG